MTAIGLALCLAPVASCSTPVVTVPLPATTSSADAPISAPPGTRLWFDVHAARYSHSGGGNLVLDAELRRNGHKVAGMTCEAFDLSGAGVGWGVTQGNSDCRLIVPPGGADTVHVGTRLDEPGASAAFTGLEIRVLR